MAHEMTIYDTKAAPGWYFRYQSSNESSKMVSFFGSTVGHMRRTDMGPTKSTVEEPEHLPSDACLTLRVNLECRYHMRTYQKRDQILLPSLFIVSLMALQKANLLQLQNSQLSSHSSSLSNNLSNLNKIVSLEKSQVLADSHAINWTPGITTVPLDWSCQCFQYSGYLRMSWTSATNPSLRVTQFGLNFTTPSMALADFKIPISSEEPFNASLVMANCSVKSGCTATLLGRLSLLTSFHTFDPDHQ